MKETLKHPLLYLELGLLLLAFMRVTPEEIEPKEVPSAVSTPVYQADMEVLQRLLGDK